MKRIELPAEIESLAKAIELFTRQADRGTALVAAAWLDDALATLLRSQFREDKSTADEIFRADGPLGSFSARIDTCYLLSLLEPMARRDLDLIRMIRNEFAHTRSKVTFASSQIKNRCNELHAAKACAAGGVRLTSSKHKFMVTAFFLLEYINSVTNSETPLGDTDIYGSWIRSTVKHASLVGLAKQLKVYPRK
jgi:DNA-binding MltR family transcriptional regulator